MVAYGHMGILTRLAAYAEAVLAAHQLPLLVALDQRDGVQRGRHQHRQEAHRAYCVVHVYCTG